MDDFDWCDECRALGDDYFFDEDGELTCACVGCLHNRFERKECE